MIKYKLKRIIPKTQVWKTVGTYETLDKLMEYYQEKDIITIASTKKDEIDTDHNGNIWYNQINLTKIFGKNNEPTIETIKTWIESYEKIIKS